MAEQFVVLKEQLDIAATYAETTYAGKEAFDAAVAKAQDIYDNLSADPQEAAAELAAAIKAYRLTQVGSADEPADYTFMIVNNGFETGDLTGWTTSSEGDTGVKSNTTAPYTCEGGDGSYLFNTWNNGVGYEISQEIEGLPVGFYSLTVAFASDANVNGTLCLNDAVVDTESSPTGASLFVDHTTDRKSVV